MSKTGSFIAEIGTQAFDYLKNNPAEAVALGAFLIPGVGLTFAAGRAGFALSKFLLSNGAKLVKAAPKTSAGITAAGIYAGQDALNPMIESIPKIPEKVVEGVKGIPNVLEGVKEGYSNLRDKLGFESPSLLTPSNAPASMPQVDTTTTDAEPAVAPEAF